jgi:hypothetical protein
VRGTSGLRANPSSTSFSSRSRTRRRSRTTPGRWSHSRCSCRCSRSSRSSRRSYCRGWASGRRWRGCRRWRSLRTVSAADIAAGLTSPHNHFTASPHRRMVFSSRRCIDGAGGSPSVAGRIIPPAGVACHTEATPDNHFTTAPHCRVIISLSGRVGGAGRDPTICAWIVSAARIHTVPQVILAAPDNHFIPRPNSSLM